MSQFRLEPLRALAMHHHQFKKADSDLYVLRGFENFPDFSANSLSIEDHGLHLF
jgi:hypothetical protein